MPNYDSPTMSGIGFNFTTGGYTVPGMDELDIRFGFRPSYQQTGNIQAAINVFNLYQTSTYTYLKSCPTYVMGYGSGGIQIIKGPCVYGGIRDLGGYIYGNPEHADLAAFIDGKIPGASLSAYIKATIQNSLDLSAFLKTQVEDSRDLNAIIAGDFFKGAYNLPAYLLTIPPKDLSAYLNVIEIRDLHASIQGDMLKGSSNLGAVIHKIFQRSHKDLNAFLHGYDEVCLPAYIGAVCYRDLSAIVHSSEYVDLSAYLFSITPKDLFGFIHGYATKDLSAFIIGGYGPTDLRGHINAIQSINLPAYIGGYKGIKVPYDLGGIIEGYYTKDLIANINAISPYNLPAYLNAVGKTINLNASIYPMVIQLKRVINVSLLEHTNLWAVINAHCFNSKSEDLSAYLYPIMRSDLKSNIIGWYGNSAGNLNDLSACVNASDYIVEDIISVKNLVSNKYTKLKIEFNDTGNVYNNFDTLNIKFGSFYSSNLNAYIYAMARTSDLSAALNVVQQVPYREAPAYMKVKTREVVINLDRFEPRWRRVAELFFDNFNEGYPYHYFYVEGENKVYKIDREKHWIIRAVGYTRTPSGSSVDRQKIWRKYIFDMSKYDTVDDAVRDLIDRVTFLRRDYLSAYINGVLPTHKDLGAVIDIKSYNRWVHHLKGAVRILQRNCIGLSGNIAGNFYNSDNNLSASIIGDYSYNPSGGNNADFAFTVSDVGYTPPNYDDADYEFNP